MPRSRFPTRLLPHVLSSLLLAGLAVAEPVLIPGYDSVTEAGLLLEYRGERTPRVLVDRPGWHVREQKRLTVEGLPAVLVVWVEHPAPTHLALELWTQTEDRGLVRAWPAGPAPRAWRDARLKLRAGTAGLEVLVERSLDGENQVAPLPRRRELYRLTTRGLELSREAEAAGPGPDPLLNRIADRLEQGRFDQVPALVFALPEAPRTVRDRAALLVSRYSTGPAQRAAGIAVLRKVATSDSPLAAAAAARIGQLGGGPAWASIVQREKT